MTTTKQRPSYIAGPFYNYRLDMRKVFAWVAIVVFLVAFWAGFFVAVFTVAS